MSDFLDGARRVLAASDTEQVAVITEHHEHWYWARIFVKSVLGRPEQETRSELTYPGGKWVRFFTTREETVNLMNQNPILGFYGDWIFFGRTACDYMSVLTRAQREALINGHR